MFLNRLHSAFAFAVLVFASLSLLSCQSSTKVSSCQGTDWYEMGRRHGTSGEYGQLESERRRCMGQLDSSSEAIYTNGYNNGLSEYCTLDNGYALGKSGVVYRPVCPRPMDQAFLNGYSRGKTVRELENQNETIDRKISSLNEKIKTAKEKGAPSEHGALVNELSSLQQELQANRRRLNQMEKQIN